VDNLLITFRLLAWVKCGLEHGKKEKKKETPIRSLPHYIRDTE
jgi:hypothetical protein